MPLDYSRVKQNVKLDSIGERFAASNLDPVEVGSSACSPSPRVFEGSYSSLISFRD
jgi:hypothetical protein